LNYIDPVAYAFESLMVNEFSGRTYTCTADLVPNYGNLGQESQVCNAVGAVAGLDYVMGDDYINSAYKYYRSHKWRNIGILFGFMIFFLAIYLTASEHIRAKKSKGEVLLFQKGHIPAALKEMTQDEETSDVEKVSSMNRQMSNVEATDVIQRQTAVFSWRNVCYDIKIKGEERKILDHVGTYPNKCCKDVQYQHILTAPIDGWVKPGTLTALMGVSGAGKTTLLDVLATRVTMGVISGEMLVNGRERDNSFQRKTGYVQQQDLHLSTSTVREALNFSALLRQPASVSRKRKLDYVDEVIKLLDMQEYADAVVGVPGEGLNVEQRKRLTVGVELAAKPQLLLFLDEPTSGLDSQTSWAICDLMEKLKNSGQAILCTSK
jgi:ABC-type Mn2+/Zn2+ transport system ATPase subunit